jgi:hypothetical protein
MQQQPLINRQTEGRCWIFGPAAHDTLLYVLTSGRRPGHAMLENAFLPF